ncbi:unnamed protein product [Protopolystoma xenopodis]|uniref:Uncharacterized protein n=1 Tax=Protopolystoma xenopodis TaxID=117903 RepID=A0A448XAR6_9PLAT|nr:unnamed protein product [Protopolystoma xenopodis]
MLSSHPPFFHSSLTFHFPQAFGSVPDELSLQASNEIYSLLPATPTNSFTHQTDASGKHNTPHLVMSSSAARRSICESRQLENLVEGGKVREPHKYCTAAQVESGVAMIEENQTYFSLGRTLSGSGGLARRTGPASVPVCPLQIGFPRQQESTHQEISQKPDQHHLHSKRHELLGPTGFFDLSDPIGDIAKQKLGRQRGEKTMFSGGFMKSGTEGVREGGRRGEFDVNTTHADAIGFCVAVDDRCNRRKRCLPSLSTDVSAARVKGANFLAKEEMAVRLMQQEEEEEKEKKEEDEEEEEEEVEEEEEEEEEENEEVEGEEEEEEEEDLWWYHPIRGRSDDHYQQASVPGRVWHFEAGSESEHRLEANPALSMSHQDPAGNYYSALPVAMRPRLPDNLRTQRGHGKPNGSATMLDCFMLYSSKSGLTNISMNRHSNSKGQQSLC